VRGKLTAFVLALTLFLGTTPARANYIGDGQDSFLMAQDVGRHVVKLRYEMERRSMDAVACKDIIECADLLTKIARELRDMASLEKKARGDYIEIVV